MTEAVDALERLRERGWTLTERRVFTLRRSGLNSFHGEELEDVIRPAEAREAGTAKLPKPLNRTGGRHEWNLTSSWKGSCTSWDGVHNDGSPR